MSIWGVYIYLYATHTPSRRGAEVHECNFSSLLHERSRRRWKDNIKMNHTGAGNEFMNGKEQGTA
jgi:hypothetical protein